MFTKLAIYIFCVFIVVIAFLVMLLQFQFLDADIFGVEEAFCRQNPDSFICDENSFFSPANMSLLAIFIAVILIVSVFVIRKVRK